MLISRVAHRFAKSILDLSIEMGQVDAIYQDALLVNGACNDIHELNLMFSSPVIKTDNKIRIFKEIFGGKLSEMSDRFFVIIIKKGREKLIKEITYSFIKQYKVHKKIHTIYVETASPLSEENRKGVMEYLQKRTDEVIELVEKVNEELVGGIILRMKDVQIDASVKNNLLKLDRVFSQDLYSPKY